MLHLIFASEQSSTKGHGKKLILDSGAGRPGPCRRDDYRQRDSDRQQWDVSLLALGEGDVSPSGIAPAEDGLVLTDLYSRKVWQLRDGRLELLAGGLSDPMGLCWSGGALYVAETGANRIVKIENGRVSPVAGSGEEGAADGAAAQASFAFPQGVAVDRDGTVYVADTGNGAVRRVRDGTVSTLLSQENHWEQKSMLAPAAPTGLLLAERTLYICDSFNRAVYVLPL